jgi:hypothetical protein
VYKPIRDAARTRGPVRDRATRGRAEEHALTYEHRRSAAARIDTLGQEVR